MVGATGFYSHYAYKMVKSVNWKIIAHMPKEFVCDGVLLAFHLLFWLIVLTKWSNQQSSYVVHQLQKRV